MLYEVTTENAWETIGDTGEAKLRIREQLHSVQVGLNLLRKEMLAGDFHAADLTYATVVHCLEKISSEKLLAENDTNVSCHCFQ